MTESPAEVTEPSEGSVEHDGDGPESTPPAMQLYVNPFYRFMTVVSAGLVAVLGLAAVVVSRTLKPPMPIAVTVIAGTVTLVLFIWYLLGMRSGLAIGDDEVVVTAKVRRVTIPIAEIEWITLDTSIVGILQPAGRSLQMQRRDGTSIRVIGALPSEAQACAATVADLQRQLGSPESANESRLDRIIQDHFGEGPIVDPAPTGIDWDAKVRSAQAGELGESDSTGDDDAPDEATGDSDN